MNNLNDLTLEQKATIVKKARYRDRQNRTFVNQKLVAYLFDLDRNQSLKLCNELGLYAWACDKIKVGASG